MKIAFIGAWDYLSGLTDARQITKYLAKSDNEIVYFYPTSKRTKEIIIDKVKVVAIYTSRYGKYDLLNYQNKVNKYLSIIKPDIIHIYRFLGCMIFSLFRHEKVPYIIDIRTGSINNTILRSIENFDIKFESKYFDEIFVISKNVEKLIFNEYKKHKILPIGVDIEMFEFDKEQRKILRQYYKIDESSIVLVYHGSLDKKRNIEKLLRSVENVINDEKDIKFVIIGKGDQSEYIEEFKERNSNIIYLGYLDYTKIAKILNMCDIGLSYIPNIVYYNYQLPLKTLEYLSSGLICVATDTFANIEVMQNVKDCFISTDNITEYSLAIKNAIEYYKENNIERKFNSILLKYNWRCIVEDILLEEYNNIISKYKKYFYE